MPITEQQKERRKNYIGASDVAALFGLDPFRTPYDVYLEKTDKLERDRATTAALERGTFLESAILNWFVHTTGLAITRNQFRSAKPTGIPLGSNCDAIVNDNNNPVEAKSQGAYATEVWGDPGTDELPDRVILQAHAQMICTATAFCYVPVYLPYRDFQLFQVELRKEISVSIIERVCSFWDDNVQKDIPPEGLPSLSVIKRVKRTPNKVTEIDLVLVEAYEELRQAYGEAGARKEQAQAAILAALGDAEAATAGNRNLTYYKQTVRRIDSTRLNKEKPEIAAEYLKESIHSVLRFPKSL